MTDTPQTYCIIDTHTQRTVATGLTFRGAHRSADRRDNAYGAIRYIVRAESTPVQRPTTEAR